MKIDLKGYSDGFKNTPILSGKMPQKYMDAYLRGKARRVIIDEFNNSHHRTFQSSALAKIKWRLKTCCLVAVYICDNKIKFRTGFKSDPKFVHVGTYDKNLTLKMLFDDVLFTCVELEQNGV